MRLVSPALSACLLLSTPQAQANGRFPLANQLVVSRTDPSSIVVRTTFGMLVSHDAVGFRWICEAAIGYAGAQDPGIGVFGNGAIALAAFEGLAISQDGGCDWAFVGGGLATEFVIDVAVEAASPLRGVAITSTGVDSHSFHVQVFETVDGAKSWAALGSPLAKDLLAETIDIAPSNPKRLYVSGTVEAVGGGRTGAVESSIDRGGAWTRTLIDLAGDQSVFIGAAHPVDEKRLYLRTRGSSGDRLIVSSDGGAAFVTVLATTGPMLGLAVSPDGARIAIGGDFGVMVAATDDLAFHATSTRAVTCLTWSPAGLYACGSDVVSATTLGATIARSADEGQSWQPVLPRLATIQGPLDTCAKGSAYDLACASLWPALATTFGGAGSAGAGGASASGGGAPASAVGPLPSSGGGSCGCSTASSGSMSWAGVAAVAMAALRRRRRAPSGTRSLS